MPHLSAFCSSLMADFPVMLLRYFLNDLEMVPVAPIINGITFAFEELSDLYSLPNIVQVVKSRRMRWAGHVARMGEGRGVHRVLVGKPEGKKPPGRRRRRWEDNIKMGLQEVGGVVGTGWSWLRIGTGGGHL